MHVMVTSSYFTNWKSFVKDKLPNFRNVLEIIQMLDFMKAADVDVEVAK